MIKKLLVLSMLPFLLAGCSSGKSIDDYSQYEQLLNECRGDMNVDSMLAIFPDPTLLGQCKSFLYCEDNSYGFKSCFFFLEMKYSPSIYSSEITRLTNLTVSQTFSDSYKQLLRFNDIESDNGTFLAVKTEFRFEYVRYFEATHIIAYIYNQSYSWDQVENMHEAFNLDVTVPAKYDAGGNTYDIYH